MYSCINCNIALNRCNAIGNKALDNDEILTVFRHWRAPEPVYDTDRVCQACWSLAQEVVSGNQPIDEPKIGHTNICFRCSRSLAAKKVVHRLNTESTREARIFNVIQEWSLPRTISTDSRICHTCWVSADRASSNTSSGSSTSHPQNAPSSTNQLQSTILLPDYMRAIETENKCFIDGCTRTERNRVPRAIRKILISQHNYYVPENNRLCDQHLMIESWNFLDTVRKTYVKEFTAKHIQDMIALIKE